MTLFWHWTFGEYYAQPSRQSEPNSRAPKMPPPKDEEESEGEEGEPQEDHDTALCGACGQSYDDFWICCDLCEKWFHGKCVKITPAKAEHIKQYKCPSCTGSKRVKAWVQNGRQCSKEPWRVVSLNCQVRAATDLKYLVRILAALMLEDPSKFSVSSCDCWLTVVVCVGLKHLCSVVHRICVL